MLKSPSFVEAQQKRREHYSVYIVFSSIDMSEISFLPRGNVRYQTDRKRLTSEAFQHQHKRPTEKDIWQPNEFERKNMGMPIESPPSLLPCGATVYRRRPCSTIYTIRLNFYANDRAEKTWSQSVKIFLEKTI